MSSFLLKIIACFTMLIDHIGLVFFPGTPLLRIIGRIAMPIFAFQVGIGFKSTKSRLKYISRMFICALLSQLPLLLLLNNANINEFSLEMFSSFSKFSLNICFTFGFSLLFLYFMEASKKDHFLCIISFCLLLICYYIPMDYGLLALALVTLSYFTHNNKFVYFLGMLFISAIHLGLTQNIIQFAMLLSIPFILFFNQKQGPKLKYLFYVFFPLHMILLFLIKVTL